MAAVTHIALMGVLISKDALGEFGILGEGRGSPLRCSCLENPRVGGACWAAVSGAAQSQTRLKRLSSSSIKLNRILFGDENLEKIITQIVFKIKGWWLFLAGTWRQFDE